MSSAVFSRSPPAALKHSATLLASLTARVRSADRERNLAQLTAQSAEAYYEADRQAAEVLAALRTDGPIPADVAVNRVSSDAPEGSKETVSFTIPIGEEQGLEVEALLRGGDVEVLRWQTAYTGGWETDDTLDLWSGDIY